MTVINNSLLQYLVASLAAYLIGAIPFGFLIVRWVKEIDIRTVGSGNIGATNVGRILGFRYFLLVLALDLLKGFVPTIGLPLGLRSLGVSPTADLPVSAALSLPAAREWPPAWGPCWHSIPWLVEPPPWRFLPCSF
jgi:glycerol-3-phosphate acyltransferase PlsY